MHLKLPVVLLSAFALVAPAISADAKDKGKGKSKDHKEHKQKADDRTTGHGNDRDRDRDRGHGDDNDKITICHVPPDKPSNRHTITVSESAWAAHSGHGDHRGACANDGGTQGGGRGRFDRLDTNNDGVISRAEWSGDQRTFDRLDRNDDGVISRREYRR